MNTYANVKKTNNQAKRSEHLILCALVGVCIFYVQMMQKKNKSNPKNQTKIYLL